MNLLDSPWIPVRADSGRSEFRLLSYRDLLCESGRNWQISLPRDDLELACLQLLVCMTQVMFVPNDDAELRALIAAPLDPVDFEAAIAPFADWFDLDHSTQPFMQTRGVNGEWTSMQKLLPGLPEVTSKSATAHCFFNEVSEATYLGGTIAAIALFNQASNCPSFGGGFKGSLRGAAPITTLVFDTDLRRMVWRNVLTRQRLEKRQIEAPGPTVDKPVWVEPIFEKSIVQWNRIGLMRGLFWQPAHVELINSDAARPCDVLGGNAVTGYSGFRKEKFNFSVEGMWPHPHGAMRFTFKSGELDQRFASFTTTAPAWTQLSEFVVPRSVDDKDAKEGSSPAAPVEQAAILDDAQLQILIGGYRTNKASVLERRHELVGLAQGWRDGKLRLTKLVELGKAAKKALRGKLYFAVRGNKDKEIKGLGAPIHETAERLFYARTENLIHQTFSSDATFREWDKARGEYAERIALHCREIFEELTAPYAMKPELIPVIAWARRALNTDLKKLMEDHT